MEHHRVVGMLDRSGKCEAGVGTHHRGEFIDPLRTYDMKAAAN